MKSFSFNSLAIIYSLSILLTWEMFELPYLPIIPIGGFIISSIVFLIFHYIYIQSRYEKGIQKNFFTNYLIGFGLLLLAFIYLMFFSLGWQIMFDLEEITITDLIKSIAEFIPKLIGFLILSVIKTLVLALLIPLIFYGKST